jgi:hypothetical protein
MFSIDDFADYLLRELSSAQLAIVSNPRLTEGQLCKLTSSWALTFWICDACSSRRVVKLRHGCSEILL